MRDDFHSVLSPEKIEPVFINILLVFIILLVSIIAQQTAGPRFHAIPITHNTDTVRQK